MRLGLKVKILLGLSTLLVAVIVANLFFTLNLLIKDKKAYILEHALSQSEGKKNSLLSLVAIARSEGKFLASMVPGSLVEAKKAFDDQEVLDSLIIIKNSRPQAQFRKGSFPKASEQYSQALKSWADAAPTSHGTHVSKINGAHAVGVWEVSAEKTLGYAVNLASFVDQLSGEMAFSFLILSPDRQILWEGLEADDDLQAILNQDFLNSGNHTQEMELNSTEYLVSLATESLTGIKVLSLIPSDKAYAVVRDLVFKTLGFGLGLFGMVLLAGLWFSTQITTPLRELVRGAQRVAQGNFDEPVEVQSSDETALLAREFNSMSSDIRDLLSEKEDMIAELQTANAVIEDYSKNLEKKVEERTAELKSANKFIASIIDSIDEGLVVFGPDLTLAPVHSRASKDLFGRSPEGLNVTDFFEFDDKQTINFSTWADIAFSEKIPFDSARELAPKETVRSEAGQPDFQFVELSYFAMRNDEEEIENIVAVAKDKTEEMALKEERLQQSAYVKMLFNILSSKERFSDFILEVERALDSLGELRLDSPGDLVDAMNTYHSLYGSLSMYGVLPLARQVRECENEIVRMKETGEISPEKLHQDRVLFRENFRKFREEISTKLGIQPFNLEVDKGVILYMDELIQSENFSELKAIFRDRLLKRPLEDYFSVYQGLLRELENRLGKKLKLQINNGDLRLDPEQFSEFFSILVHLFRNSADHGIESPETRLESGKSEVGTIAVSGEVDSSRKILHLRISDDGAGIDPAKIRQRLSRIHGDSEELYLDSDEQIIQHIFDADFSTKEELSLLSGRGAGMNAVKAVVEELGGDLRVESIPGQGTTFIFELPVSS